VTPRYVAGCLLLLLSGGLGASPAVAQEDTAAYANTPEALRPYRHFERAYRRFFTEAQAFRGPGREALPPDVSSIKIGILAPLDGSRAARYGRRIEQGALLALEDANADGGYGGLPFEAVARNDLGLWGASSNELVALYEQGVWATVGSLDGANSHIMVRLALKLDMPIVNTATTDPTLTETAVPWIVRCIADDRQISYALALHIHRTRGLRRIALLRSNDRYGRVGTRELVDAMKRLGAPIALELRFAPGRPHVTAELERIRASGVEGIVVWGDAEDAASVIRQIRDAGLVQPIFGPDPLGSTDFLAAAGPAAEGVTAVYPFDPSTADERFRSFAARYEARFGTPPDAYAAHAYDGMAMVVDAIRHVGLNHVRIRDALTGLERFDGVTGVIPFDATWNDVGPVWMVEIRDGARRFFSSPTTVADDGIDSY
jgi:ABC-type branched-subunit amino acid transport system substrate-binding protein